MMSRTLGGESAEGNEPPAVLAAALDLVARGFAVFPVHSLRPGTKVCTCGKAAACKDTGKHPRTQHGLTDATTDSEQIKAWWRKWPDARVGVVPGSGGCFVIDGDLKGGDLARASLAQLTATYGASIIDNTFKYATPSGGFHAWLRLPAGITVGSGNDGLGRYIDIKSDGGYVVYWAAHGYPSSGLPIAEAPATLVAFLLDHKNGRPKFDRARALAGVPEHQRQDTLFRLACSDRARRVPLAECKRNLRTAAASCDPPFTENTDAIAERVYDRYAEPSVAHPYFVGQDGYYRFIKSKKAVETKRISDFTCEIVAERHRDDGEREVGREYTLRPSGNHEPVTIPAEEFNARGLDKWIHKLGRQAMVEVGEAGHLINAVKKLSYHTQDIAVFECTGWRKINGVYRYLHPGLTDILVELPGGGELNAIQLPPLATTAEARLAAICALFNLRNISRNNPLIGYTAMAGVFLAALGVRPDVVILLTGMSGTFKSAVAAAMQNAFAAGAPFRFDRLPANWSNTGLSLRLMMFAAKDAVFVVDEHRVKGDKREAHAAQKKFIDVVGAIADSVTGAHSDPKHSLHIGKRPRCLLVATAEQILETGGGTAGRIWAVRHSRGDVSLDVVRTMHETDAPLYAVATRGFTDWLAPQYDAVRRRAEAGFTTEAARVATEGLHTRTPAVIGKLYTAVKIATEYALAEGALSSAQADEILAEAWAAFTGAGAEHQRDIQHATDEIDVFFDLVRAAIEGGHAHLTAADTGEEPHFGGNQFDDGVGRDYSGLAGWKEHTFGTGENVRTEWRGNGRPIGHIWPNRDGTVQIGLNPRNAEGVAQRLDHTGDLLPLSELGRRLVENKRLLKVEKRGKNRTGTAQKTIQGKQIDLFWVRTEDVLGADPQPRLFGKRDDAPLDLRQENRAADNNELPF